MITGREMAGLIVCFSCFHDSLIVLKFENNTDNQRLEVKFSWKLSHDEEKKASLILVFFVVVVF